MLVNVHVHLSVPGPTHRLAEEAAAVLMIVLIDAATAAAFGATLIDWADHDASRSDFNAACVRQYIGILQQLSEHAIRADVRAELIDEPARLASGFAVAA